MKKRMFALLSVLCLTVGCFGACGKNENKEDTTPTPEVTATVAPSSEERGDGPATSTPAPTATTAPEPTATTAPEPTATTAPEPTDAPEVPETPTSPDLTYDFNDLTYNTSYGTQYTVEADGSIALQFEGLYQEIKLNLPEEVDMTNCTGVTVKLQSEIGNVAIKLYDKDFNQVFVDYNGMTTSVADYELTPAITEKVAGIGLMACSEMDDYSQFTATVYSITFHMTESASSDEPATPEVPDAPVATTTPEPTKAPEVSGPADLTYDFNDLAYNMSYGTNYTVQDDGSIALQFDGLYQEIKLDLPQALDMSYCTGVTVKMQSEAGNLAVKLYDEGYAEVFVRYDGMTAGVADHELSPVLTTKVAGIGLMACSEMDDYSQFKATVYSVTFHMKEGWDSGAPAPTPEPIPVDPNDTGIWENNADISWIDPSKPMIAFTFDDGPFSTAESSAPIRIQNALRDAGQHATFFYWGAHITESLKAEIQRAYDLGFEIGNHTNTHPYLTNLTADKIYENYMTCADKLTEITGLEHFLVRPPYLATNATVKSSVREPMINCSIDSKDWDKATTEQILNTIRTQKKDGAIVLMHENYTTTAEAMEILIPELVADGWQIVSVSELFKAKGQELKDGEVYSNAR